MDKKQPDESFPSSSVRVMASARRTFLPFFSVHPRWPGLDLIRGHEDTQTKGEAKSIRWQQFLLCFGLSRDPRGGMHRRVRLADSRKHRARHAHVRVFDGNQHDNRQDGACSRIRELRFVLCARELCVAGFSNRESALLCWSVCSV